VRTNPLQTKISKTRMSWVRERSVIVKIQSSRRE
jgi:hypothetical protein